METIKKDDVKEIPRFLTKISSGLDVLGKEIAELADTISPIMVEGSNPENALAEPAPDCRTAIGRDLFLIVETIERFEIEIKSLRGRIEL